MSVSSISQGTNAAYAATQLPGAERVPQKTLGQQEFFKLIAVQFASQDPLKPMEDTAFIAQLANFSALENSTQLTQAFRDFSSQQGFVSAQNLLGQQVTLTDVNDTDVTGIVSSVHQDGANTLITVNGIDYTVGSVRRVELNNNQPVSE